MFLAKVFVTPQPTDSDPRERTTRGGLGQLGLPALVLAFVLIVSLVACSQSEESSQGTRSGSEGHGERIADQGTTHVNAGQTHPPYNSVPATSGWHYAQSLAPTWWGVHEEALADEVLVHNLEHGGIAVHYDCPDGCDELVSQLMNVVDRAVGEEGLKVLLAPYPDMDTTIALTAWTFVDKFDVFDEERVNEFIRARESSTDAPEPTVP